MKHSDQAAGPVELEPTQENKRVAQLFVSLFLLLIMALGTVWTLNQHKIRQAKRFCESLLPELEARKAETGYYPGEADPGWWAGKSVPSLIHTQDFYVSFNSQKMFQLRFYDPYAFRNDIWAFDSRFMAWRNYD